MNPILSHQVCPNGINVCHPNELLIFSHNLVSSPKRPIHLQRTQFKNSQKKKLWYKEAFSFFNNYFKLNYITIN